MPRQSSRRFSGRDIDIAPYEGLVFSTAVKYAPLLDDDLEDVQQILRLRVAFALDSFDPTRSNAGIKSYVFSCVRNQVKDLLKSQYRRNDARNGRLGSIEEMTDGREPIQSAFEMRYLSQTTEQTYALIEDEPVMLPSTLTEDEARVVELLVGGLAPHEIARSLKMSRERVATLHADVQRKMLDWHPGHDAAVEAPTQVAA